MCYENAKDYGMLLSFYAASGDKNGMASLSALQCIALNQMRNVWLLADKDPVNISFMASFLSNDTESCIKLLEKSDRVPEASLFSMTYAPSKLDAIVERWQALEV